MSQTKATLDMIDAAGRRAAACGNWRWLAGMLLIHPPAHGGATGYTNRMTGGDYLALLGEYPDLTDPATLGCLLALVREAWGQGVYLLPDGGWYVKGARLKSGDTINLGIRAATEAEALVLALEAAQ
jgi:hypothetical protein